MGNYDPYTLAKKLISANVEMINYFEEIVFNKFNVGIYFFQCELLLNIMGVTCVYSLGEAEKLCAILNKNEVSNMHFIMTSFQLLIFMTYSYNFDALLVLYDDSWPKKCHSTFNEW